MLILTRYTGQSIVIADNIVVRVLRNNGSEVTLGIDAPRDVKINREEIQKRMEAARLGLPSADKDDDMVA